MSYFNTAFGGFAPHRDEDAAVKFILNVILMDRQFDALAELVMDGSRLGAIEGEPGWKLERRDDSDEGNTLAYSGWPSGARFRAYVDPQGYELAHPECFMDRATFFRYLRPALSAYIDANPSSAELRPIASLRAMVPA